MIDTTFTKNITLDLMRGVDTRDPLTQVDYRHQKIRRQFICPLCLRPKSAGLLCCGPCSSAYKGAKREAERIFKEFEAGL